MTGMLVALPPPAEPNEKPGFGPGPAGVNGAFSRSYVAELESDKNVTPDEVGRYVDDGGVRYVAVRSLGSGNAKWLAEAVPSSWSLMGDSSRLRLLPLLGKGNPALDTTRGGVKGPLEMSWTCPGTPGMLARRELFRIAAR